MHTRNLVKFCLVFCSTLVISPIATAGFSTYAKDWPNDADIVGEGSEDLDDEDDGCGCDSEDNSKVTIKTVNSTLNSTLKDDTPEEGDDTAKYVRIPETGRLYLKFGCNVNHAHLKDIKNYSYNALSNRTLTITGQKQKYGSWEAGFGTKINSLRYEVEYIKTKKIAYNPHPIFKGRAENLTSTVANRSLLLNIFYDIPDTKTLNFTYVRPYIGALVGANWSIARSTMQGGVGTNVPKNSNKLGIAWGFTFGARVPIASRWSGYLGYRYVKLPKVVWKDATNALFLRSRYTLFSVSAGVNFII